MRSKMIVATVLALTCLGSVCAQDMDKEITGLSDKLSKALVSKAKKKVAPIDFVDLQGRPTELGRFLAEQLSVDLVNTEGISVVDRANIKSILAEHKLTEEGLVKPENAKQLGQFAGVDAILIGTVTPMDDTVVLTVKAVSTETAEIVAAGKATFKKTVELQQLLNHVASTSSSSTAPGSTATTVASVPAIAMKDIDNLRVTLLSVQPVKFKNYNFQTCEAFQFTFDLANRSLQQTLGVSLNRHINFDAKGFMATLLDSAGNRMSCREIRGVASIGISQRGYAQANHTEGDIINFIKTRKQGENKLGDDYNWIWEGTSTPIKPNETVRMTLTFVADNNGGQFGAIGSMDAELVVAAVTGEKGSETLDLKTFTFDNVKLPKAE